MQDKKKISVVVPMYYEEEVVDECYNRLTSVLRQNANYDYEIVFVDDGSKDKTLEKLRVIASRDASVKIISFSRNFGHQVAVTAGLRSVTGDATLIIDADMQDPPEVLWDMVELWKAGNDVVYAKRKRRKGESLFKLATAKLYYKLLAKFSDLEIPKDTGDFRLVDKKVVNIINIMPEKNKFLRGIFSWIGFKQVKYEYERQERTAGKTKYTVSKMVKLAEDGMVGFSNKLIKLPIKISMFMFVVGIVSLVLSIVVLLNNGCDNIFLSLWIFSIVSILGTLIFFVFYIMGLYVSRIYEEVKGRPEYIIKETINVDR